MSYKPSEQVTIFKYGYINSSNRYFLDDFPANQYVDLRSSFEVNGTNYPSLSTISGAYANGATLDINLSLSWNYRIENSVSSGGEYWDFFPLGTGVDGGRPIQLYFWPKSTTGIGSYTGGGSWRATVKKESNTSLVYDKFYSATAYNATTSTSIPVYSDIDPGSQTYAATNGIPYFRFTPNFATNYKTDLAFYIKDFTLKITS